MAFGIFLQGKITAQGKLLKYGSLHCHEGAAANHARAKEHVVFLFEQSVIISEALPRRSPFVNPGYLYKSHIQVSNQAIIYTIQNTLYY